MQPVNFNPRVRTYCFWWAVGSHGHTDATSKIKQVIQSAANRSAEWGCWRSWRSTKTSPHLRVIKHMGPSVLPLRRPLNFKRSLIKRTYSRTSSKVSSKLSMRSRHKRNVKNYIMNKKTLDNTLKRLKRVREEWNELENVCVINGSYRV